MIESNIFDVLHIMMSLIIGSQNIFSKIHNLLVKSTRAHVIWVSKIILLMQIKTNSKLYAVQRVPFCVVDRKEILLVQGIIFCFNYKSGLLY